MRPFCDYSLVGVLLLSSLTTKLHAASFMLSCRVLGKGVEHRMARPGGEAATLGLRATEAPLRASFEAPTLEQRR